LTASAGVAPNKFLAKVGSAWNKPNGLFVILPDQAEAFSKALPVEQFFGVGKVTLQKLHQLNLKIGADLQALSLHTLSQHFGKLGARLYGQCRGLDERKVEANRERKSLSVEQTFQVDITGFEACEEKMQLLYARLIQRIAEAVPDRQIKGQYLKIKFADFKLTSVEIASSNLDWQVYYQLLQSVVLDGRSVRLLGVGVNLKNNQESEQQASLF